MGMAKSPGSGLGSDAAALGCMPLMAGVAGTGSGPQGRPLGVVLPSGARLIRSVPIDPIFSCEGGTVEENALENVYCRDTHVHTHDTTLSVEDADRFAWGEARHYAEAKRACALESSAGSWGLRRLG